MPETKIDIREEGEAFYPYDRMKLNFSFISYFKKGTELREKQESLKKKAISILEKGKYDLSFKLISSSLKKEYEQKNNQMIFKGYRYQENYSLIRPLDFIELSSYFDLVEKNEEEEIAFDYSFLSSKEEEGRKEALENALKKAKEKAELIAKTMGLIITSIEQIETEGNYPVCYSKASISTNEVEDAKFKASVHVTFLAK